MRIKHFLLAAVAVMFVAVSSQAATLRSDLETNRNANPIVKNNPNLDGATIKRKRASYTFTGSEASADIIEMVRLPKGSIVLREMSTVNFDSMAAVAVVEVGDADDPDRYCSALGMNVASSAYDKRITFNEAVGTETRYDHNVTGTSTTSDTVDLTLTTITTPTAGSIVSVEVVYCSTGS